MKKETKSKTINKTHKVKAKRSLSLSELPDILSSTSQKEGDSRDKSTAPLPHLFFSIRDACLMLKLGRSSINRAIREGYLESCQLGSRRMFTLDQLKAFAMKIVNSELSDGLFEKKA